MQPAAELSLLGKRRDRLEVIRDILTFALDGASTTRIVYKANLTFPRFKKYSARLVAKRLLTVDGNPRPFGERIYKTTDNGKRFLRLLMEISEFV